MNSKHSQTSFKVCLWITLFSLFISCKAYTPTSPTAHVIHYGTSFPGSTDSKKAKTDITESLKGALVYSKQLQPVAFYIKDVRLTEDSLIISRNLKKFTVTFDQIDSVKVTDWGKKNNPGDTGHYQYSIEFEKTFISWSNQQSAQQFADALAFFKQKRLEQLKRESLETFAPVAAQYKALKTKPAVSEEQRRLIVQATTLAQQRKYNEAIEIFDEAISIDQVNPLNYYNQALLWAQVQRYDKAINQMKKYLMLVPDASDARKAQDKIYEWEILQKK